MVDRIEDLPGFSGKPWPQYPEEIEGFIRLLMGEGVRSYMEIGCRYGDTFHAVGCALEKGSILVAVDLPGAKSGMKNKGGHQDSWKYLLRASDDLRNRGQKSFVILGDSHEESTKAQAAQYAPFDALLIDGDHTAEGVRKDWHDYGGMARIVAFHDIAGDGKWARQIRPLYEELASTHRHREFIFDGKRRGIGVIWRG